MLGLVSYNIIVIYLDIGGQSVSSWFSSFTTASIVIMIGINLIGYFLLIFAHVFTHPKQVCRLLLDTFSYWYYQGAYMQTMVAHAFCNVDDVSWGTKGSTNAHGGKTY